MRILRTRFVLAYSALVVVPLLLVVLLLGGAETSGHEGSAAGPESGMSSAARFLVAAAVIIIVARVLGSLGERFGQPRVIGEVIAGIALGPSLLGLIWPGAVDALFPASLVPHLDTLSGLGLAVFMFLIGLELDLEQIKGNARLVVAVGHASVVIPFLLGVAGAFLLFPELSGDGAGFLSFALFAGLSVSITAFPVLARILVDRGLQHSRLGVVAMCTAALTDVTGWCVLALVVTIVRRGTATGVLVTVLSCLVFLAVMVAVVRPLLRRLLAAHEAGAVGDGMLIVVALAGTLFSAALTDLIGVHMIFGAFLFGAVFPRRRRGTRLLVGKLHAITLTVLLPFFFVHVGLQTKIGLLGTDLRLWGICGLVVAVSVIGKWGSTFVAATMVGERPRDAMALGVLMNCRGLTELIMLEVGLSLHVISPALFTILVLMALVTTVATAPLLDLLLRPGTRPVRAPGSPATLGQ